MLGAFDDVLDGQNTSHPALGRIDLNGVQYYLSVAPLEMALPIPKVVNPVGLIMDVVGVLLLSKFGLPEDIRRKRQGYILLEETDQNEIVKAKRYDCWARIPLGLVVLGFVAQLIGNFL